MPLCVSVPAYLKYLDVNMFPGIPVGNDFNRQYKRSHCRIIGLSNAVRTDKQNVMQCSLSNAVQAKQSLRITKIQGKDYAEKRTAGQ